MPAQFEAKLAHIKDLEGQVEVATADLDAAVWRVLRIFEQQDFGYTKPNYHHGSPNQELVGNHLWSQSFDTFYIEDGELAASGMYSGSRSYYEPETVRFPAEWLDLSDAELPGAMQAAWQAYLDGVAKQKANEAEAVRLAREFRDHEEYERLKKKFG